jgi:hypothetical protein
MRQQLKQLKKARKQYRRAERQEDKAMWSATNNKTKAVYEQARNRCEELGQQVRKLTPRFWSMFDEPEPEGNSSSIFPRKDAIGHIRLVRYIPSASDSPTEDASYALGRYIEHQDTIRIDIELDLPDAHIETHRAACYLCQEDFQEHKTTPSLDPAHTLESPSTDDEESLHKLRQLPCSHVFHVSVQSCP